MPRPYHTPKSERDAIVAQIEISEALADLELAEIAVENTRENDTSELAQFNRAALVRFRARYDAALPTRFA